MKRSGSLPFIDQSARLASRLDDPRIVGLATSRRGEDAGGLTSDGHDDVADTSGCSDGDRRKVRDRDLTLACDWVPLTRDSGGRRVSPGSHRAGDGDADRRPAQIR